MSDLINLNPYNRNENRAYPIDDSATLVDSAGLFLPHNILVDARVIVPKQVATSVWLGAVTAMPLVTTVVLMAGNSDQTPLGAVTVPAPVTPYAAYPISAFVPGVGGWLVFGSGALQGYTGRFALVSQTRLLARCVRPYRASLVTSFGKENVLNPLEGLINLVAGADFYIQVESAFIDEEERTAIVFGLKNTLDQPVLSKYIGPCGLRPESGNCPKTPIQTVNNLAPDCTGNIDLDFQSMQAIATRGGGGITLSLNVGMAAICPGGGESLQIPKDRCAESVMDSSH